MSRNEDGEDEKWEEEVRQMHQESIKRRMGYSQRSSPEQALCTG